MVFVVSFDSVGDEVNIIGLAVCSCLQILVFSSERRKQTIIALITLFVLFIYNNQKTMFSEVMKLIKFNTILPMFMLR